VLPEKIASHYQERLGRGLEDGEKLIPGEGLDFAARIRQFERAYLLAALERAGGVGTRAAELLRMSYRSFKHYAKKHNV
jgi:two-component system response regulator PilR (NtrC family)